MLCTLGRKNLALLFWRANCSGRSLGTIRLQPQKRMPVVAPLRNLTGILPVGNLGAGSPETELYSWPTVTAEVA